MDKKKIISFDKIRSFAMDRKNLGDKIVFTNGCFDILHAGHINYLNRARSFGDLLMIGLNSDASIKLIKGADRPIIEQYQRALVLSALSCVDCIVLFDDKDPENLIKEVMPDVLVKGADWEEDDIVGSDIVKQNSGVIKRVEFEVDISTTQIIRKINGLFHGKK